MREACSTTSAGSPLATRAPIARLFRPEQAIISTTSREVGGMAANRAIGRAATSDWPSSERTAGSLQRHPVEVGARTPS